MSSAPTLPALYATRARARGARSLRSERALHALPALVIILPMLLSVCVWLLPVNPAGLTGFVVRSHVSVQGCAALGVWTACAVLAATAAFSAARRSGPISSLRAVTLDEFHVAALAVGAAGTLWIYYSVTGGSLSTLVALWTHQDFTRFRTDFDYGIGIATGRYAAVLAGGISLARFLCGRRMRHLDAASLAVLIAVVLLNSRVSALMAVSAALSLIVFSPSRTKIRPVRAAVAVGLVVTLFVVANYTRNAEQYRAAGVTDPIAMAAMNAQAYLATPANVALGVSSAAIDGRALPPTSLTHAADPALPPYLTKVIEDPTPVVPHANVENRYQGTVDLSLSLTTNGTFVDVLMESGWLALITAVAVIFAAMWAAGRFVVSGPIGAIGAGVLLYALSETWRVFLFNTGNIHFIVLFVFGAALVGWLRATNGAAAAHTGPSAVGRGPTFRSPSYRPVFPPSARLRAKRSGPHGLETEAEVWSAHGGPQDLDTHRLNARVDRVVSASRWALVQTLGVRLLALVFFTVLARLLPPSDFGTVALCVAFVAVAQSLLDSGVGAVLIQKPDLKPTEAAAGFVIAAAVGGITGTAILLASDPLSTFFREPGLEEALRWSALVPVVYALGAPFRALLARTLDFRALAMRSLVATLLGGSVGVACALLGWGALSLVAQIVTAEVAGLVAVVACHPRGVLGRTTWRSFRSLLRSGASTGATSLNTVLYRKGDDVLIGRFLGSADLGIYAVAYRILTLLSDTVTATVLQVALPSLSRVQRDRSVFLAGMLRAAAVLTAVGLPVFALLAVVSSDFVTIVFGDDWRAAGPVLAGLALWGAVDTVGLLNSTALLAGGFFRARLLLSLGRLATLLGAFLMTFQAGVTAIAIGLGISLLLYQPVEWLVLRKCLQLPLRRYAAAIRAPVASTACAFAVAVVARYLAGGATPAMRLTLVLIFGGLAYSVCMSAWDKSTLRDVARLIRREGGKTSEATTQPS